MRQTKLLRLDHHRARMGVKFPLRDLLPNFLNPEILLPDNGLSKQSLPEFLHYPKRKAPKNTPYLHVSNASCHNITNLNVKLPLSKLVCIAGVSGSGKSTLLHNIIYEGLTSSPTCESGKKRHQL